ncbi:hypothetical protein [Alkalilimnicola ehrlichii]|uniref:hypothetical protein n=1 Tax=Alkalilimnicola ehrlichii TaxID=351052 RepID=UPI003BA0710E
MARIAYPLVLALLSLVATPHAMAVDRLSLDLGSVTGEGWHTEGLSLHLPLRDGDTEIRIDTLRLDDGTELTGLSLRCGTLELPAGGLRCEAGTLSATLPHLGKVHGEGRLALRLDGSRLDTRWQLTADSIEGHLTVRSDPNGWTLDLTRLRVSDPGGLLADWLPAGTDLEGELSADGRLTGDGQRTRGWLEWRAELSGQDATGRLAAEGLRLGGRLMAHRRGTGPWALRASLDSEQGQAYAEPVFLDLAEHPARLTAGVDWEATEGAWDVRHFTLRQQGQGELTGQGRLDRTGLRTLSLRLRDGRADGLYAVYLHPWLLGGNLDQLQPRGRLDARLEWADGAPQVAEVTARGLQLDDAQQRFALRDFTGQLLWHGADREAPPQSRLRWREARLLQLPLGETALRLTAHGRELRLPPGQRLPIVDGALRVHQLRLSGLGTDQLDIRFEADILPIDLRALTTALDWPPLSGTLSGRLPELSYRDGRLGLGGTLIAQVFGGLLRVDQLSLEDPFGPAPVLRADLRMRSWDLDSFTEVLELGRIEGYAHADILGLHLIGWEPVAFDARIWSPEGTGERRRISQRAVENITQIGGSTPADWVSRQVLRFFDTFRYRRLGISCRLEGGVCHMGGVAPANGGYYLIEGRALPRLNIIGFATEVSWPALREQIGQVLAQEEAPVVD